MQVTLPLEHIEGKYEILHKIKEGGMGAIYKVRHRLLEEIRVIKVIRPQFAEDQDLKRRFAREAKTAIRLRHPNIAQLYDFAAGEGGTAYMVMEFIDGHTLQETLRHYGPPSLGLATDLLGQALQALDYLHRQGYVHRDISPDNLMMTRDFDERPMIKLIDLGIVKRLGAEVNLTTTGTFLGKVRYSSPEQFNAETGSAKVDARSDVYSFGLLTYELLTGRFPVPGDDFRQLLTGHLMHPPLAFTESDPEGRVPEELRRVVLRALEKEPADRFPSAKDFAEQLEAFGADFEAYRHEFARRLSRSDVTQPMEPVPRPGSTQERLNEQFGVEPTPSPTHLTPPPPPPPDPEAERKKREAERAEAERRKREAEIAELLGHALETREDDPETARGALRELLELEPEHTRARDLLERVEAVLERRREAAQREEAERRRAEALEAARSTIAELLDRGALDEAEERLRQAIEELDTELPGLQNRLETLQAEAARATEARSLYEQARGQVEAESWEEARNLLGQALEQVEDHPDAQALLERVESEIERLEAEREAERRRAEAIEAACTAVTELLDEEDPDAAEARLEKAEDELETRFPELHTRIDELRTELERRARARDAYAQARQAVDEEDLEKARKFLLQALEGLPQHAEAKALLDEIDAEVRRREEEAERARRLSEAVGDIEGHLDQGEVDTAARELDFAVQTWGGSPELVALARRIDEEKRRWEREEALVTLLAQAREHRDAGRLEDAAQALKELVALQPEHREARSLLSSVEADVARREIEKAAAAVRPKPAPTPEAAEPVPVPEMPPEARATVPVDSIAVEHRSKPEASEAEDEKEPTEAIPTPEMKSYRLPWLLGAAAMIVVLALLGLLLASGGSEEPMPESAPGGDEIEAMAQEAPATEPEPETSPAGADAAEPASGLGAEATTEIASPGEPVKHEPENRPEPRRDVQPSETRSTREPAEQSQENPPSPTPAVPEPDPEPETGIAAATESQPGPSLEESTPPAGSETEEPEPTVEATFEPPSSTNPEEEEPAETAAFARGDLIETPGPGVEQPVTLHSPKPAYPLKARQARYQKMARVVVLVLVDEEGHPSKVRVQEPDKSGLGFNEAALAAARDATFRPATKDGIPGKMWVKLVYGFRP